MEKRRLARLRRNKKRNMKARLEARKIQEWGVSPKHEKCSKFANKINDLQGTFSTTEPLLFWQYSFENRDMVFLWGERGLSRLEARQLGVSHPIGRWYPIVDKERFMSKDNFGDSVVMTGNTIERSKASDDRPALYRTWVILDGECPAIGSGMRNVEIIEDGEKYLKIRHGGQQGEISRPDWNAILTSRRVARLNGRTNEIDELKEAA